MLSTAFKIFQAKIHFYLQMLTFETKESQNKKQNKTNKQKQ